MGNEPQPELQILEFIFNSLNNSYTMKNLLKKKKELLGLLAAREVITEGVGW